jgi:Phage integrase family
MAGLNGERPSGALVHGVRHTFATELANANVSVYTLMKLLGHESMATSQRYVDGAGADGRAAAQFDPLYELREGRGRRVRSRCHCRPRGRHHHNSPRREVRCSGATRAVLLPPGAPQTRSSR